MKLYNRITIVIFSLLAFVLESCDKDIDNYKAPDGGVYGSIIDKVTNEPIPLPVGNNSGALINIYELNDDATVAITTRAKTEGSYAFSTLFNGKYRLYVEGPFVGTCEGVVTVNGNTEFNLYTLPFSRIAASATVDSNNVVTIHYKADKLDETFSLSDVSIMWNYTPEVDVNSSNYASIVSRGTADSSTYQLNLYNDPAFAENYYKILSNDGKVYVRVSATVNSNVNYSKVLELKVK